MAEQTRPPIVTILGHVDHGKTSLLDFIRQTKVADKEHGGITQAIGAYQIMVQDKLITFIDTPGHAAFEQMRSRGARVADVVVLVVAADDGVMPQTVEAIKHIQEAKVPLIVAINKVDLPGINLAGQVEKIKRQLNDNKVLIEEYGGDVPLVQLSAKTGLGVDSLLENILLVAEMHELKGDPAKLPSGVVIESRMDKNKGVTATILIRDGTLKKGEVIVIQSVKCKVKSLTDYAGKQIEEAGPSTPVEVLGWEAEPGVGGALGDEAKAAEKKIEVKSLIDRLRDSEVEMLNVVIRADKQGSLEAIEQALEKFNEGVAHLKVISSGTGEVLESDIQTAIATRAIVIGFNTEVKPAAARMAETAHVLVRSYKIIYELLDELKDVVEGMLQVKILEEVFGRAQIIAEFPYGKTDKIAGCKILEGTFSKGPKIRIVRGDTLISEGKITSIKMAREEVIKIEKGQECGMMFTNDVTWEIGDLVESYRTI